MGTDGIKPNFWTPWTKTENNRYGFCPDFSPFSKRTILQHVIDFPLHKLIIINSSVTWQLRVATAESCEYIRQFKIQPYFKRCQKVLCTNFNDSFQGLALHSCQVLNPRIRY